MFNKLSHKLYIKAGMKYPHAMRLYLRYKNYNEAFHINNKSESRKYLFRLISAEKKNEDLYKVEPPIGTFNPYLKSNKKSDTQTPIIDDECKAIPDSKLLNRQSPEAFANDLSQFDVVSFDVFDTLIFRPFAIPTDLFYLMEAKTGCFNF